MSDPDALGFRGDIYIIQCMDGEKILLPEVVQDLIQLFRGGGVIGPGSGNGNRGTPWEQAAPASPQKGCGFQSSGSCCFVPRFN